jgi:hypothetical protein
MNTNFIDREKLANTLRANVLERFSKDFDRVRGSDGDLTMQSLYISDASHMLKLCYLIKEGRYNESREYCSDMDTAPRDQFYVMVIDQVGQELADQIV